MLDPKTLKVGSVIRLTGMVMKIEKELIYLRLEGKNSVLATFYPSDVEHAELVSSPRPTISKEAAEAIKAYFLTPTPEDKPLKRHIDSFIKDEK